MEPKYYMVYGQFPEGREWFVSDVATGRIVKRGFETKQATEEWLRKHEER